MKRQIIECIQGSDEWFDARLGIVTASNFSKVLAKGAGKTREGYMHDLIGERGTGNPASGYTDKNMENGTEMEPFAREVYEEMMGIEVRQVGFIRWGDVGASPDGLVDEDGTIEIKCPTAKVHVGYCLGKSIPYKTQMQGVMWVSGRKWCDFVSFHEPYTPRPIFIKRFFADEEFFKTLAEATAKFVSEMKYFEQKIKIPF